MAAPSNWIWDTAPSCIQRDVPPGLPFGLDDAQNVFVPFQNCTGYFTFGPGREWAGAGYVIPTPEGGNVGDVIFNASTGLYVLTVLGFLVMILVFVAFVWTEHRKLMDRAAQLRGMGTPHVGGPK